MNADKTNRLADIPSLSIREALAYGRRILEQSPSPALDARLLLQHVLQKEHPFLIAHDDTLLTAAQTGQFHALLDQARQGQPIPYLIGRAPFFGRDFAVSPVVLIPRPETEQLVDAAVAWARSRPDPVRAVDVGTGSGCIAVTLAHVLPDADIIAIDISREALSLARENAQQHGVGDHIDFRQGDLLAPIRGQLDLIVANLPYIGVGEWTMLDDAVKLYEPTTALKGGGDGLDLVRKLLGQARTRLRPNGAIFLEIGWQQGQAAQAAAQTAWPAAHVEVRQDYAGHDRIIVIQTD